jgi:hypothetical protein
VVVMAWAHGCLCSGPTRVLQSLRCLVERCGAEAHSGGAERNGRVYSFCFLDSYLVIMQRDPGDLLSFSAIIQFSFSFLV